LVSGDLLFLLVALVCLNLVVCDHFVANSEVDSQRYRVSIGYLEVLNPRDFLKHIKELLASSPCDLVSREINTCQNLVMFVQPIRNNLRSDIRNLVSLQIQPRDHVLIFQEVAKLSYVDILHILVLNLNYRRSLYAQTLNSGTEVIHHWGVFAELNLFYQLGSLFI
jgi:hypothetical protein